MPSLEEEFQSGVRSAYARAFSEVWLQWDERVKKRPTAGYTRLLRRSQWLAPEEIEAEQLSSLRKLLSYAGANVPYYRALFKKLGFRPEDVTQRKDLAALPPLTREILLEQKDDLLAPEYRGKTIKKATSGSTGIPASIQYNVDSEAWRQAVRIRGWGWGGYDFAKPVLYYWGNAVVPNWKPKGIKMRADRALKRELYLDALKQDEASLAAVVDRIRTFRPSVVVCYPQAAAALAQFILATKARTWTDIPTICGGEALLPQDRKALSEAFGSHVYETYGSRETMLMASECSEHSGMHLSEENILLEVTENGVPVADGKTGAVLVTDLHNYAMPLIRYENRDLATMKADPHCKCGRGLRLLERVDGRIADVLRSSKGTPVPTMLINVLMTSIDLSIVKQFQVHQKKDGATRLMLIKGPNFDEAKIRPMVARLEGYLEGTRVSVEYPDVIPAGANGKQRHVLVEKA